LTVGIDSWSLGFLAEPSEPVVGATRVVRYRDNDDPIGLRLIADAEGKATNSHAPDLPENRCALAGVLRDSI
jgi:hypothetical protein